MTPTEPAPGVPSIERYLHIRAAVQPSFSPDGSRLAFLTNITGDNQIWAMPSQGGWPEQVTFGAERVMRAAYSPVERRLIFTRDAGGNENAQIFTIGDDGSDERRLTFDDGAMHILGGCAPNGRSIAFAANRRDRAVYDLYALDLESGAERMVWENRESGIMIPQAFSPDGLRVLVSFSHNSMNQDVFEVDLDGGGARLLTANAGDVRHEFPAYGPGGEAVYCLSDQDRELAAVVRIDRLSLERSIAHEARSDIDYLRASPSGDRLVWAANQDGGHQLLSLDLITGDLRTAPDLPAGVISPKDLVPPVFSGDGRRLAFAFTTPRRAAEIWVWEIEAGVIGPVTHSSPTGIPDAGLVEPALIRYRSFDGREIPAWYFRSAARRERGPAVVYAHGGPESQARPQFLPELQYLAAQGIAVLAPNVRGSTGYGKTYAHLDDVERRPDAVADLAYAGLWLREQPDVDPARLAVYGASYGGFMVLAALVRDPDLWAAGVDICGIGNFVTFLENTGPYRRSVREAEYGSLARHRQLLMQISPANAVDRIRAPLMIIHGANDPRVPVGEAQQIAAALRERGVPVELLIYPDEGHGLVRLRNRLDAYPRIAAFLDGTIGAGGRRSQQG